MGDGVSSKPTYYLRILSVILVGLLALIITIPTLIITFTIYILSQFLYWIPYLGTYLTQITQSTTGFSFFPMGLYMGYTAWIFRDKIYIQDDGFDIINPRYDRFISWDDVNELQITQLGCNILHKIILNNDEIHLANCENREQLEKAIFERNILIKDGSWKDPNSCSI